jgi:hypothetical protein
VVTSLLVAAKLRTVACDASIHSSDSTVFVDSGCETKMPDVLLPLGLGYQVSCRVFLDPPGCHLVTDDPSLLVAELFFSSGDRDNATLIVWAAKILSVLDRSEFGSVTNSTTG